MIVTPLRIDGLAYLYCNSMIRSPYNEWEVENCFVTDCLNIGTIGFLECKKSRSIHVPICEMYCLVRLPI